MAHKKKNKYLYLFVVQGKYSTFYEDLCASEVYKEAREDLIAYENNETEYPHRIIRRREVKEIY